MLPFTNQAPEFFTPKAIHAQLKANGRHFTASIALCALMLTQVACSGDQSSADYISQAERHLAGSNYKAAGIELKNALQKDGNSAHARWLLGQMHLETGDISAAEKELLLAQELNWEPNEVRPALGRTQLLLRKYAAVRSLQYEDLDPQPASSLLTYRASAELEQGETDEASRLIELALARQPESVDASLVKARVLATQGDSDASLALLNTILTQRPEHAVALSLKGDILLQRQDMPGAIAAFDSAIALSESSFRDRFKRALIYLQLQDSQAAQADTLWLLNRAPQHPASNYLQGVIHFGNQQYPEAISSLSLAEPAAQQFPLVLFYLASAQMIEGNRDAAANFASRFHNMAPDDVNGRKLLATIRLEENKLADTRELIVPVLASHPDDAGALNLMANTLLREGKTDQAIDMLGRVAALQPDSPVAQVRLGAGLMLSGKGDEATQHIETALALNPEFQQADILLVMGHLRNKEFDAAIEAAQSYRQRNPVSTTPYNLLGKVYLASGDQQQAKKAFEQALALDAGDPGANHNLALMALAESDREAARQYYQATITHHPDSLATLLQLARLDAGEDNEEGLVKHLEQAIKQHPKSLEPRLMLARYYLAKDKPEQVTPLFATLEELQQRSPQVLHLLALAQLSDQHNDEAQYTLEQLVEATPESAPSHHLLGVAAARGGDNHKAKQELNRALALNADYIPSRIALGRIALAEKDTATLESHLDALTRLAPAAPDVLRLRAAAAYEANDAQTALKLTADAFKIAPNTQTMLELYDYYQELDKSAKAETLLSNWLAEHPEDDRARMAYANAMQSGNKVDQANEQYRAIVDNDPDNAVSLNNLAWNLRKEQPKLSLEYARRAAELAPERPEILDTLAVIEHLNGDNLRAQRNIQRALAGTPDNPSMLYHEAMIASALGEKQTAKGILERLLGPQSAEFPERAEAGALLELLRE